MKILHKNSYRRISKLITVCFILSLLWTPAVKAETTIQENSEIQLIASAPSLHVPTTPSSVTPHVPSDIDVIATVGTLASGQITKKGSITRTPPPGMTEQVELRTQNSQVFMREDGTGVAYAYTSPVHYQTDDGSWELIDNTLIPDPDSGYGWRNAANDLVMRFAVTGSSQNTQAQATNSLANTSSFTPLATISKNDYEIGFELLGANPVQGQAKDSSIIYKNILADADLRYWVTGDSFKEDLIFHTNPAEHTVSFKLKASGGTLKVTDSGAVVFEDCVDDCLFIAPPFLEDDNGETSYNIAVELLPTANSLYQLNYKLDSAWLDDASRAYPVVLDPTTLPIQGITSFMYLQQGAPNVATCNAQQNVYIGFDNTLSGGYKMRTRGFFYFDLPTLPPGANVSTTNFIAYQYGNDSGSYNTNVHRPIQDWHNGSVCANGINVWTWNNPPAVDGTTWTTGLVDAAIGWKNWDITSLAQQWFSGALPNHGIAIYAANELAGGGVFCSAAAMGTQCAQAANAEAIRPYVYMEFSGPAITSGINLNPSGQAQNVDVNASFTVQNGGATAVTMDLRVSAPGVGDFPTVSGITLNPTESYNYSQVAQFATLGSFPACAQYSIGGSAWQDLPTDGGVACATLNILDAAPVQISTALALTPNRFEVGGGTSTASFEVRNTGTTPVTERFRARVTSGSMTFDETADITLNPNETYSYSNAKVFSEVGVFEVIAEHRVGTAWIPLIGQGNGFIHVKAPAPPPVLALKGTPTSVEYCGDPVNSATGNYVADFTDMFDPTPGLSLSATRWYNAIDAATINGPFGYGTSWLYGMSITWRVDKSATVVLGDGQVAYFVGEIDPANPSDMSGVYASQGKDRGTLTRAADGTAVLLMPDQTQYQFNAAGQLIRISHPYPATIDIVLTGGRPTELQHSAGVTYTISYNGSAISQIESSSGQSVSYTYSGAGDLVEATLPDGASYKYTYDANHRLTEARTPNDQTYLRNVYDAQGRVIEQADQTGKISTISYNAGSSDRRSYIDALGNEVTHVYDAELRVIEEIDPLGRSVKYERDPRGNITKLTNHLGHVWQYTYDAQNNLLSETSPLGSTTQYTYDAQNNLTSVVDALGNTTSYSYDSSNHLIEVIDSLNNSHLYGYDNRGNLIHEQDALGAQTWYGYNQLGQRTIITDSLQLVTRIEYDTLGNISKYTDAAGRVAQSTYDERGRLVESIDPIGTVVSFKYDPMGNLLSQTDGMGNTRHYIYDVYDRLIEERDFLGNATKYSYDTLGRRTKVTDALGFTSVFTYNQTGELESRQEKDGSVTRFVYDDNSQLLSETDQLGRVTSYVYDAEGRQIERKTPCDACASGFAVSKTSYDALGRVINETDARGAVTRYTHDVLGRVATKELPNGGVFKYTYDPVGRLIQEIDPLNGVTQYTYDSLGRVLSVRDPLNRVTTNSYDAVGNLLEVTDALGNKTKSVFDANDRLIKRIDALGNETQLAYDAQGRQISETDALGNTSKMSYDANGNQISSTDRTGAVTRMEYDALHRQVKRIDALNGVSTTIYDAMGRVIATKDALGGTTSTSYDAVGRRISESDVLGQITSFVYDSANNLVQRTEPNGAITRYTYDALGQQLTSTNALGYTRTSIYSIDGKLIAEKDERGFETRYEYDLLGRQVKQIDALGNSQSTSYDAAGQVVSTTDYNGNTTSYLYDTLGNQISVTDALGGTSTSEYDALNRTISSTDALGRTYTSEYNKLGNLVKTTSPAGNVTSYSYDAEGRQIKVTDALGNSTLISYDALGRTIKVTDALGRETSNTYDALGRLTSQTDALERVTRYSYDAAGKLLSITAPGNISQRYTYDAAGNVLSEQDGSGTKVLYTYDLLNRTTSMIYGANTLYLPIISQASTSNSQNTSTSGTFNAGRRVWSYTYDAIGNQTGIIQPSGQRITMSYDELNRLKEKRYGNTVFASYTYDANGNRLSLRDSLGLTSYSYDKLNRLISTKDQAGRTVSNSFDAVGQRIKLTYPDSSAVAYAYNLDGALNKVTGIDGGATTYTLDALNRTTRIAQANGVIVEQRYDAVGNLIESYERGPNNSLIARYTYSIDQANRRTQQVAHLPQGSVTTNYTYDALDRLLSSKASDGTESNYSFDAAGNRIAEKGVRIGVGVSSEAYETTYSYSLHNELLSAKDSVLGTTHYSYNADGQRIGSSNASERARYSYDAEGHLIEARVEEKVGTQWLLRNDSYQRYSYDGNGRRVRIDTHASKDTTLALRQEARYDDFTGWDVLLHYNSLSSPKGVQYIYDQPLNKLAYHDGSTNYFVNDNLGSVVGASNSSGALTSDAGLMRYDDYGQQIGRVAALPTTDGYTGYEFDDYTGLNYARNRYYDPSNGTFLSIDPWPADRQDVLGLHRYLYTQANPINNTDPLGLWGLGSIVSGIGNAIMTPIRTINNLSSKLSGGNNKTPQIMVSSKPLVTIPAPTPRPTPTPPIIQSAKQVTTTSQQNATNRGTTAPLCGVDDFTKKKNALNYMSVPCEYYQTEWIKASSKLDNIDDDINDVQDDISIKRQEIVLANSQYGGATTSAGLSALGAAAATGAAYGCVATTVACPLGAKIGAGIGLVVSVGGFIVSAFQVGLNHDDKQIKLSELNNLERKLSQLQQDKILLPSQVSYWHSNYIACNRKN